MIWIIEIGLVLLLFGGALTWARRGRSGNERESVTTRRVEAYMQTIRRERKVPALVAMTDTELRDVLLSSARNLRIEAERRGTILIVGSGAVLIAAIFAGSQDGTRGFAVAIGVGALALYGLYEWLTRKMREPLEMQGIEVERLRVD